jgi:hypothetical protein
MTPAPPAHGAPQPGEGFGVSPGWCAPEVEQELPGLRLLTTEARVARKGSLTGSSPPDILARLRELSNRMRGATAVTIRRQPVPSAYRVFFRHIGLDPDSVRTPIEAAALERMLRGGFLSAGLIADVLTIALLSRLALFSVQVDGVPGLYVEEALWNCRAALELR